MPALLRLLLLSTAVLAACNAPAPAVEAGSCSPDARFRAEIWGDMRVDVDWQGTGLDCDGMPRPHGQGGRLRFAGDVASGNGTQPLALIVALPALEAGVTASELAAKVTLMQEDQGRFYSTGDNDLCWADITRHEQVGSGTRHDIAGIVYCVAPLPETRGDGSIVLRDVAFSGRVDWQVPE